MTNPRFLVVGSRWLAAVLASVMTLLSQRSNAGGVTIITHGLNGDTTDWITAMADDIPDYATFDGTNFTCYEMYFYQSGGSYYLAATRDAGSAPNVPESGEIVVKLDWSILSDGNSYNTYQIADAVVPALLDTNFISELGGHALAEWPLHLIGHSRGGSLICEMSRLLGTNGIWVDQVTTLDPHPLNNDGFTLDSFLYSDVDAPARTYENVLFSDNYYETLGYPVNGEAVGGAYVRELTSLSGGYSGLSGPHSNVHLWYHGTLDWRVPTTDSGATLGSAQRQSWWTAYEDGGTNAGFLYSLIGGGNRLSTDRPAGQGAIMDGFNQNWDLGAGASGNRTALSTNDGEYPSLILFDLTSINPVSQGGSMAVELYYQWAHPATDTATISIYLDDDLNPLNTNQTLLTQLTVPGTGADSVSFTARNVTLTASNAAPGYHELLGQITGGGNSRFLYAPQSILVTGSEPTVSLDISQISPDQFVIGANAASGSTVVLESSPDLLNWIPFATNAFATSRWMITNSPPSGVGGQFYRAILSQ